MNLKFANILTCSCQICECSLLFARLEVLNISGNRLTDACGSYLSTILKNCTGKLHDMKLCQFEYCFSYFLKNADFHVLPFSSFYYNVVKW